MIAGLRDQRKSGGDSDLLERQAAEVALLHQARLTPVELLEPGKRFIDLGDLYRSADRDYDRAYEMYQRARERLPRDETAYRRLSDICRRRGRPEEAIEWADRWRKVNAERRPTG